MAFSLDNRQVIAGVVAIQAASFVSIFAPKPTCPDRAVKGAIGTVLILAGAASYRYNDATPILAAIVGIGWLAWLHEYAVKGYNPHVPAIRTSEGPITPNIYDAF